MKNKPKINFGDYEVMNFCLYLSQKSFLIQASSANSLLSDFKLQYQSQNGQQLIGPLSIQAICVSKINMKQKTNLLKLPTLLKIASAIVLSIVLYDFMVHLSQTKKQQEEINRTIMSYLTFMKQLQAKMHKTLPTIDSISDQKIKQIYAVKQRIETMSQMIKDESRLLSPIFLTPQRMQRISIFEEKIHEQAKILDVLYTHSKQFTRKKRINFFSQVAKTPRFSDANIQNALSLLSFNLQTGYMTTLERRKWDSLIKLQQASFSQKYRINTYVKQIPLCVVVSTKNNAKDYQFQSTLQSIINQDYLNYRLIIIDDASLDHTVENIHILLRKKKIPTTQYVVIANGKLRPYVMNVYSAITNHCDPDDTAVLIRGGDELIGNHVFSMLNAAYRFNKVPIVFTNHFYGSMQSKSFFQGNSSLYLLEKRQSDAGSQQKKYHPLRTFKVGLFLKINEEDLKQNEHWYQNEESFFYPMIQMSCGKMKFIDEYVFFANYHPQINRSNKLASDQQLKKIKRKTAYKCLPQYVTPHHT